MFETAIERARAEVGRLRAAQPKLRERESAARAAIVRARAALGEAELSAILDGSDPAPQSSIVELEALETSAKAALHLLTIRIMAAVRELNRALADDLRRQARELEKELEAHNRQRDKLLKAIEDFEGVPFAPAVPPAINEGTVGGRPILLGPAPVMPAAKSATLAARVASLYAEAKAIETRQPQLDGQISANSLGELLAAALKAEIIAPSEDEIRAWFEVASTAAARDWARRMAEENPNRSEPPHGVSFRIAWGTDGRIDPQRSAVTNFMLPAGRTNDVPKEAA